LAASVKLISLDPDTYDFKIEVTMSNSLTMYGGTFTSTDSMKYEGALYLNDMAPLGIRDFHKEKNEFYPLPYTGI